MRAGRISTLCLALAGLASCSYQWTASVQVKLAHGQQHVPLQVLLTSSLGDHVSIKLDDDCIDVRIRQHPKLPNKINISIYDATGALVGATSTHDLANQKIEIPLTNINGLVVITPSKKCRQN